MEPYRPSYQPHDASLPTMCLFNANIGSFCKQVAACEFVCLCFYPVPDQDSRVPLIPR